MPHSQVCAGHSYHSACHILKHEASSNTLHALLEGDCHLKTATTFDCSRIWESVRVVGRDIHNAAEPTVRGQTAHCLLSYLNFKIIPACKTTYGTRTLLGLPQRCDRGNRPSAVGERCVAGLPVLHVSKTSGYCTHCWRYGINFMFSTVFCQVRVRQQRKSHFTYT